jgi:hypothetical protein
MYIGEIEEVGIIEPVAIPESQPADTEPDLERAVPRKAEELVPAR